MAIQTIRFNKDIQPNYMVLSRESGIMCLSDSLDEIRDSLGGDLDKDWIIYAKTTYSKESSNIRGSEIDVILKRVISDNNKKRLRKLGL